MWRERGEQGLNALDELGREGAGGESSVLIILYCFLLFVYYFLCGRGTDFLRSHCSIPLHAHVNIFFNPT